MPKYKQKYIPDLSTADIKKLSVPNLRKFMKNEYTKFLQGKKIVNKHVGLTIYFGSDGKAEITSARAIYSKKAVLISCMAQLLEHAEYNNFGQRKATDEQTVFGYANFKAKAIIDKKIECVRITVRVRASGKAYYCHEISIKK